jgi:hypothetical protein
MTKSLKDRADDSFDDNDHEDIREYLEWLRATIADYSQSVRRLAIAILLLIAVFELIHESRARVVLQVASFHIYKGSVVLIFIPAIVSYLYLQMNIDSTRLKNLQEVFTQVFRRWNEKAEENDLDVWVKPPQAIYWNVGGSAFRSTNRVPSDTVEGVASYILGPIFILGVLAFEAQAYYALFALPITHHIVWLISVFITWFCNILIFFHWSSPLPPVTSPPQ